MNLESFPVFSPQEGLISDTPSILLPSTATSDIQDMYFQSGEVKRYRKRQELFSALPDAVITQFTLNQASQDRKYFLYFTKNDIVYRDRNNNRYVFLNSMISGGTVDSAVDITGGFTQLNFTLGTGVSFDDVKAGDYIRLGEADTVKTTDDTWYEVTEVTDADTLVVEGSLPTGYEIPTAGVEFAIRSTFNGTDEDVWVCANASETLVATNNGKDFPIRWLGGSNEIEDITDEFKCRWIDYYGGRVVASYILANGQSYPVNYRWSGLLDEMDWGGTGSDAGESALTEGQGYITRTLVFRDNMYVFKSESIEKIWAVTSDDIFNSKVLRVDLGTKSPHSFVLYRDVIYFYATIDRTFRRFDGYYDQVMSRDQDPTIKNITTAKEKLIQGYFVNDTRQLMWSVPYAGSETLNKIFIADIDYADSPWTVIDMIATSFGKYEIGTDLDWSTLPFDDWSSWNWESWLSAEGSADTAIDCCSDTEGYVYQMNASRLDNGEEYTSYIVFETDFSNKKTTLPFYKRLLKIQFYTRGAPGGTVKVEVKRDNEDSWYDAGDFTLTADREINIIDFFLDRRAKSFKIKLSTEFDFELIGYVPWYMKAGER